MPDDATLPDTFTARFEVTVRHCPKCGWTGAMADATVRYCGPGQKAEGDRAEMFLLGEPGTPPCSGAGEHFHWKCPVCRYRRVVGVPRRTGPGLN